MGVTVSIYMPTEQNDEVTAMAKDERRSFSNMMVTLVSEAIEKRRQKETLRFAITPRGRAVILGDEPLAAIQDPPEA